jgi:ligand-binding SRPBCC domain-containing protein
VHRFRVASRLAASPEAVWARVATVEGVNDELWPIARMTVPAGATLRTGRLGRSWILLAGVLPIDWDDLCLEAFEPGRGFRERSTLASAREWHHDRRLEPLADGGCRVVDQIAFTPRVRALGGVQSLLFAATFRWRHRRLRRSFGAAA